MRGLFIQDVKRSFCNMGFWAGLGGLTVLFLVNIVTNNELNHSTSSYFIMINAWATSGFTPLLPIFPVLAYAVSFCEEYQSGYYRMLFARIKPEKFGLIRISSVAFSGGVIVALPILMVCLIALYFGIPGLTEGPNARVDATIPMIVFAGKYGDGCMVALKVLLGFLFGAAWALVGLAFAVWVSNRYVALIAPFVLYESLWLMLDGISVLNPIRLVRGDNVGYPVSLAMECVWLLFAAGMVLWGIRRRGQNG